MNFSRGGLSGLQGRAPQPFFNFQGEGSSTPIFGRFNGQNERIFLPGKAMAPLPMPAYALGYHLIGCMLNNHIHCEAMYVQHHSENMNRKI